jgi:cysteine desulfurase/selenocysteine lyase
MALNVEKVREDFEVYKRKINNKQIVYMDSACMTLRPKQVIAAINNYYTKFPACAGRSVHRLATEVTNEVENARKTIQKFFNAKSHKEIVFTKNTTESLNLVANSLNLNKGDKVLTTDKEHNSNLIPWLSLRDKAGIVHEVLQSNKDGTFDLGEFEDRIALGDIKLVSMVHTSNVDGTTIPAKKIIKAAHKNGALVLLDAAQSAPHKDIDVKSLNVDFLACSGHKMLGPSGIGVLYGKMELLEKLQPFILGGETVKETWYDRFELEHPPEKFEAGLQNYAGIIGMGAAVSYLKKLGMANIAKHEVKLNSHITKELSSFSDIELLGPKDPSLRAGIFSFNIKSMDQHEIAIMLDSSYNVMIRSGAHCAHSWFNAKKMEGSARASLYLYNTEEECNVFLDAIKKIRKLKR